MQSSDPLLDAALPLIFPITANRKLYQQQTALQHFRQHLIPIDADAGDGGERCLSLELENGHA